MQESTVTTVTDFELLTNVVSESVFYTSSDESVAVIEGNIARYVSDGTATITATASGGWSASQEVVFASATEVSVTPTDYQSSSAARAASDRVKTLVSTATGADQLRLFTTQDHASATYVRNPDVWVAPEAQQMTCISPWNSTGVATRAGTLITPQHSLQAAHYPIPVGTTMRWVAADNTVYDRIVVGKARHPDYVPVYPDLEVCTLDAPLPPAITPCTLLPAPYADFFPTLAGNIYQGISMPVLALDQEEKALVRHWSRTNSPPYSRHVISAPSYPSGTAQFSVDKELALYEPSVGGDSGNPVFAVFDGELVLLTVFTFSTSGTAIADHIPAINQMIADSDSQAGIATGYTITEADLSAFTDFS